MQQFLLSNNQNNPYHKPKSSQITCNLKMVNPIYNFSRKDNVHQQEYTPEGGNKSIRSQEGKNVLQKKEEKQIYNCFVQNTSATCPSCARWKHWTLVQQKMLIQLQKQINMKEQNIQKIIQSLKRQIKDKNNRILYLQQQLQQNISQIKITKHSLSVANQKPKEIQQITKIQANNKKQNKIDSFKEISIHSNTIQPISLNFLKTVNKISHLTKDSTFTNKTEGSEHSQTLKQKIEMNSEYVKKAQLQKYIFQNQALKDYNAALTERLKMSKYKKFM